MESKSIILTFDYELFLLKSGTPEACIFNPTERILAILGSGNIKATFFIDILYYIRLKENHNLHGATITKYENQIKLLLDKGHNLELHIHPHWLDAKFDSYEWVFEDFSRYCFTNFTEEEINSLFKKCYTELNMLCKKFQPEYKITAYRMGGLCILPFPHLESLFSSYEIKIDSSVAPRLKATEKYQSFDYSDIENINYYKFNKNPILAEADGKFTELPISTYKRELYDKFLEKTFALKYNKQLHKVSGDGSGTGTYSKSKIFSSAKLKTYFMPFTLDGCMPETIIRKIKQSKNSIITFISHPKLFSALSEKTLKLLIKERYTFKCIPQIAEITENE